MTNDGYFDVTYFTTYNYTHGLTPISQCAEEYTIESNQANELRKRVLQLYSVYKKTSPFQIQVSYNVL